MVESVWSFSLALRCLRERMVYGIHIKEIKMNWYDPSSSELQMYTRRVVRLEAQQREVQERKVLPRAPRMTMLEWAIAIAALLILCAALAFHFGLLFG
jgi:hypothetical protein